MQLLAELQRRNVIRVAVLYVVGSWLILQVGDLLFDLMGLPDYALRIVLGILVLGLPLVLVGAWVYEVTPEGIKRESEIDRSESITSQTGDKLNLAVIVAIALGIATLLADRFLFDGASDQAATSPESTATAETTPAPAAPGDDEDAINAIAVLPFEDFSAAKDQGHLATGIADTILHALAQVEGLKVAARTSSFRLAEQGADIATVGNRLEVGAVLEGSVQKAGDQLRIIAQLVQVSDESHLWSQTFDRPAGDIFAIQDEIAAAVIDAIGQDAAPETVATVANQRTSPEIYDLFLRGRSLWQQRTVESTGDAVRLLREVVARDPTFAPGHSELAQAILINANYSGNRDAVLEIVEQQASRALELDPADAAAYRALGSIEEDDERAIELYRRSLALNPNDPTTHAYLANRLTTGARWNEADTHLRAAVELDPLDIYARGRLANFLSGFGNKADEALALVRETIALAPDETQTWDSASDVYIRLNRFSDAATAALRRVAIDPRSPAGMWDMGWILARMGDVETAERWVGLVAQLQPTARAPCDWYLGSDPERALACSREVMSEDPTVAQLYDVAQALWITGAEAEALEAFEHLLERSAEDRASGFVRYSDLVALLARVAIKPSLDRPVTEEDRQAPRRLREVIAGQSPAVDRWGLAHILAVEGRIDEAAKTLEDHVYNYFEVQRMNTLPVFAELREHPEIARALADHGAKLRAEHEKLAAEGDPLILDPPATVDELIARLDGS